MKLYKSYIGAVAILLGGTALLSGCQGEDVEVQEPAISENNEMRFIFLHPSPEESQSTRATDTRFEQGDRIGLFVKEASKPLEISGNVVNNEPFTFDGEVWTPSKPLYWDKGSYDAYALYPFISDVGSITDLAFNVSADQGAIGADGLDGYELSDLLYAEAKGLEASDDPVSMQFRHIMSKLTVRLIKGEEYEGDLPENFTVLIHNTVTRCTVDINAGIASIDPKAETQTIRARKSGATSCSAIIVPQRIDSNVPIIEVLVGKVSLMYDSKFLFKAGMHHVINLIIERNPERSRINIGGEYMDW